MEKGGPNLTQNSLGGPKLVKIRQAAQEIFSQWTGIAELFQNVGFNSKVCSL